MIYEHLSATEETPPSIPHPIDDAAVHLDIPSIGATTTVISIEDLPSLDYALYLTNTVKFHISQSFHIFSEDGFMAGLRTLYNEKSVALTASHRLWYVQYLIVMAFGKALLSRSPDGSSPTGSEFLARAIQYLPAVHGLYEDPILSVEICCGLALYLQSIDHRNSAYVYVRKPHLMLRTVMLITSLARSRASDRIVSRTSSTRGRH